MALQLWDKIFVNRSLNFGKIKAVGFDMDHTIAVYNHVHFEALAFEKTIGKFIEAGYPEELSKLKFDPTSVIRGVMVDTERGNILKIDAHKYVKIAFHGKRKLKREERRELYNAKSAQPENYICVDTFFALSEVQLFTEIVDLMRLNPGLIKKSFQEIYKDLRAFIDLSHADGSIKDVVKKNPSHYFHKDKFLDKMLQKILDDGKEVFLLTNSDWAYTNAVMTYLLEDQNEEQKWYDYFDRVIVNSKKPIFFTEKKAFHDLGKELAIEDAPPIYEFGCAAKLEELLQAQADEILYVGDHIYGDIISPKGLVNWRTMLVMEDLELELHNIEKTKHLLSNIVELHGQLEQVEEKMHQTQSLIVVSENHAALNQKSRRNKAKKLVLEKDLSKLREKLATLSAQKSELEEKVNELITERDRLIHPVWGEIMKVGFEKSRFAYQVEQYACLYTSRVTNLRFYSPRKVFKSLYDILPHEYD